MVQNRKNFNNSLIPINHSAQNAVALMKIKIRNNFFKRNSCQIDFRRQLKIVICNFGFIIYRVSGNILACIFITKKSKKFSCRVAVGRHYFFWQNSIVINEFQLRRKYFAIRKRNTTVTRNKQFLLKFFSGRNKTKKHSVKNSSVCHIIMPFKSEHSVICPQKFVDFFYCRFFAVRFE